MPVVLNKRKDVIPKGAVFIGRPSKWGNPYVIGLHGDREEVLRLYKRYLLTRPELIKSARKELCGKDLVCFCAPKPCHGEFLIRIANCSRIQNIGELLKGL